MLTEDEVGDALAASWAMSTGTCWYKLIVVTMLAWPSLSDSTLMSGADASFVINDPGTVETLDMNGAPTARSWTSTLSGTGTTIQLRTPGSGSQKLLPTEYLEVIFDAQVTCTAGTYAWKSAARATNDFHNNGINFVIANSQPVPTVGVASSC